MKRALSFVIAAALVLSCHARTQPAPAAEPKTTEPVAAARRFVVDTSKPMPPGLDEGSLNPEVEPCDDFYQYACGGWIAKTEIPPDRARYSRGFVAIDERNEKELGAILARIAKGEKPPNVQYAKMLGDYWTTCVDEAQLEKAGAPLNAALAEADKVTDAKSLSQLVGRWHAEGIFPFFDIDAMQDLKDSSIYVFNLDQSGIGLPDRDFYVKDDEKMKSVRAAYLAHIATMFQLLGQTPEKAKTSADEVTAMYWSYWCRTH